MTQSTGEALFRRFSQGGQSIAFRPAPEGALLGVEPRVWHSTRSGQQTPDL